MSFAIRQSFWSAGTSWSILDWRSWFFGEGEPRRRWFSREAATLLRGHQPIGRILMLALASANLLVIPFGTALGVYALWVLLTNDAHRLFEPHLRVEAHL